MTDGLLLVALGAGVLAAVNPCGFALLPAYVSLLLAGDAAPSRPVAVVRALGLTGAMTLGFAGVFLGFGLLVAPVASQVQRHLPWVTVGLGCVLALAGLWLASGRSLVVPLPRRRGRTGAARPPRRSLLSMAGFGAGYAVASLSCTVAPFLAVVVGGFRSGSVLDGLVLFGAYALGMGLVVGVLAVATALASPTTVARLRGAGAWAPRAAGVLLAVAGAYVAWYGAWELRVLAGADADDPVVDAAAQVQRWLVDLLEAVGPGGLALALAGTLLAVALVVLRGRRRCPATDPGAAAPAEERVP